MQETRRRTVWQARQKETLIAAFSRNPYPTFREREELAREIGLPESRVRVWFQNHRSRTGVVRSLQRNQEPLAKTEARSTLKGRTRPRTQISWAQLRILHQAFERDPFPKLPAREDLARRTGLPEDTIYIWFQNRRARHHVGGRGRVRGQHSQASSALKGRGDSTESRESRCRRIVWQARQKEILITAFPRNPYLTFRERKELAREMGLPESRVRMCFQNRQNHMGAVRSQQRPEEHDETAETRSTFPGPTRPHTQISMA
ncbi:Double homeobox protein 4C [Lemmus lemmus]